MEPTLNSSNAEMFQDYLFTKKVAANGDKLYGSITPEIVELKKGAYAGEKRCVIKCDVLAPNGEVKHMCFFPRNRATEKEMKEFESLKITEVMIRFGYHTEEDEETGEVKVIVSKPKFVAFETPAGVVKFSGEKIEYKEA